MSTNSSSQAGLYWQAFRAHLVRDLRLEWRSRDSFLSLLFYALLVVVAFSLAFDPTLSVSRQISGGILAVALLFATSSALNQAWTRELRNGVLDAQRLAPAPPSALYLAKTTATFLFVSVVELVLAPVFAVFYNLKPVGQAWLLAAALPLGTWALVANGVFFAALSLRTRSRELLLPLVLLPIFVPALVSLVSAITGILTGETDPTNWLRLLAGYDVIFTTLSLMLFGVVLNAE